MVINYRNELIEGSASLLSSTANAEVLTNLTNGGAYINVFYQADTASHVFLNGSANPIYIRAGVQYQFDYVNSLKVQENAISFTWYGTRL